MQYFVPFVLIWFVIFENRSRSGMRKNVAERYRSCRVSWLLLKKSAGSWRGRFGDNFMGCWTVFVLDFLFVIDFLFVMQVNYIQNDNARLENKVTELKGTLNSLLQSRENFVIAYEVIVCDFVGWFLLLMVITCYAELLTYCIRRFLACSTMESDFTLDFLC